MNFSNIHRLTVGQTIQEYQGAIDHLLLNIEHYQECLNYCEQEREDFYKNCIKECNDEIEHNRLLIEEVVQYGKSKLGPSYKERILSKEIPLFEQVYYPDPNPEHILEVLCTEDFYTGMSLHFQE